MEVVDLLKVVLLFLSALTAIVGAGWAYLVYLIKLTAQRAFKEVEWYERRFSTIEPTIKMLEHSTEKMRGELLDTRRQLQGLKAERDELADKLQAMQDSLNELRRDRDPLMAMVPRNIDLDIGLR